MLTAIHNCKRKASETIEAYSNRSDAAVAEKVRHSNMSVDTGDQ